MRLSTLSTRVRHVVHGAHGAVQAVAAVTGGFYEGWLLGHATRQAAKEGDVRRFLLGFDPRVDNLRLEALRVRAEHAWTSVTEAFWEGRVVVLEQHLSLDEDEDLEGEPAEDEEPTFH